MTADFRSCRCALVALGLTASFTNRICDALRNLLLAVHEEVDRGTLPGLHLHVPSWVPPRLTDNAHRRDVAEREVKIPLTEEAQLLRVEVERATERPEP